MLVTLNNLNTFLTAFALFQLSTFQLEVSNTTWFTVAVLAADSAGTETDRSRRLGSVSDDPRKTLHRMLKKFWKNHDKS